MNSIGGGSGSVGSLGGVISIGLILYGLFAGNEKESSKPEEKIELNNYDRTAPIPLIYGTDKVTGTCIYLNNINIEKITYGGKGFGGPETEAWMYYADFAVGFGEGAISEYLDYKLGESGSNIEGQLSIEEFLGTPTQLKSTIIDLNYNIKNTAYLAFSGCIGTSNVLPSITSIISGIDTAIEESYSMHWDIQDPMTYVFDNIIGHYFSDDNYIYWIDERDGSIYLYNDIDNSKTLVGIAGEYSTDFQNFVTYKMENGRVYCFSSKNVANIEVPIYGYEFHYSYFYLENGLFYSIKLDTVIQCLSNPIIKGYNVTSIVGNRAYINSVPTELGSFGRFTCWCNAVGELFGGASCKIGWDAYALKYYVDLHFYPNVDDLSSTPSSIQIIHIYIGSIFSYTNYMGQYGEKVSSVHPNGIIIIGNNLYVFGKTSEGSKEVIFVEKFNSLTGERENNIFWLFVYGSGYYYRMNANISATNLGNEVAFTCNGITEGKTTFSYSQYKFFIQGDNINTFIGELNGINSNMIMVLGCKKFNNIYFLLYSKIRINGVSNIHKEYLISFTDNSLGFVGWNFLYSTEIYNTNIQLQSGTRCIQPTSSRGPNSNLEIYNNKLYFKLINLLTYNSFERFYYLTKSGIIVDDGEQSNFPTITGLTLIDPYYLISCKQRAINAHKNSYTLNNYPTRVLDYKPSIATPISVLYDFLTNSRYGMGVSTSIIDGPYNDLNTSFGSEHEFCLEIININDFWDYRFLFAKAFTSKQKGYDIIKDILKTCRGFLYFCDGKIKVHIEKPNEEPVIYFGYHKETLASGPY